MLNLCYLYIYMKYLIIATSLYNLLQFLIFMILDLGTQQANNISTDIMLVLNQSYLHIHFLC